MKSRIIFFYFLFFLGFIFLLGRLFWLGVVQGEINRMRAEEQSLKIRRIAAPRGIIYDRHHQALVENLPVYKICREKEEDCRIISRDQALKLEANNQDADLVIEIGRYYPYGQALVHVLGYLGEVNQEEVDSGWPLGSFRGRTGIEEIDDDFIRGKDGGDLIEIGAQGEVIRVVGKKEPEKGGEIELNLDLNLQLAAFEALKKRGQRAALVASTPEGEILALVSFPSFNPNSLSEADLENPDKPFFNRVISGAYPPGSTFKIITAVAGLEDKKIDGQTEMEDPGEIVIGQYRYANWYFTQYGRTEGIINLVRAIKRSTDTYFYKVGEMVGARRLIDWGKNFGLGEKTGIDLPGEIAGFLPDPQSSDWFLGNTYHLAIGQGSLGTTPLQINVMTVVIANQGKLCSPRIVKETQDCEDLGLESETLRLIKQGMKEACSPEGTAFPLFDFEPQVACKTGTAEFGDPQDRTHAWLTAFAPVDKPEIVVTALVEAGGEGSSVAAPIVKEVMEAYFKK